MAQQIFANTFQSNALDHYIKEQALSQDIPQKHFLGARATLQKEPDGKGEGVVEAVEKRLGEYILVSKMVGSGREKIDFSKIEEES